MSNHKELPHGEVDVYLTALRRQLAGLPAEDVEETLRELRGHIAERAAESETVVGFLTFLAGVVGYALGVSLIVCAILKPFFPAYIGLWINSHNVLLGAEIPRPQGHELLGWWIIPYGLGVGVAFILGTTMLLRWMLRYVPSASRRFASLA